MEKNDMKPCPFCGGSCTLTLRVRLSDRVGWENGFEPSIICNCGIDFGIGWFAKGCSTDKIREQIIRIWNCRRYYD